MKERLLPRVRRSNVQRSQIRLKTSEPSMIGSSWESFPAWRLANHKDTVVVFNGCTVRSVTYLYLAVLH